MTTATAGTGMTDLERRRFFGYLKTLGLSKEEAYEAYGIESIKTLSRPEVRILLAKLKASTADVLKTQESEGREWLSETEAHEKWEAWRARFFMPANIIQFGDKTKRPSK
ncbi:MAG: hypothetical protein JW737_00310, partial [Acidobacteria bacterium]|nr:hypothetical protein [Acidobacteriota bacterium]